MTSEAEVDIPSASPEITVDIATADKPSVLVVNSPLEMN